ncbi:hypothetical protein CEXT_786801 [Caerostris extrusa]|uniref:Uncharacterized protein n=1 Tax=Caerostris extrusa TaxID=172846 RepID=A0AAV4MAU9_CAEEX|nr:hypothetical protein CEXT_786801 [Caerostris extrusa]
MVRSDDAVVAKSLTPQKATTDLNINIKLNFEQYISVKFWDELPSDLHCTIGTHTTMRFFVAAVAVLVLGVAYATSDKKLNEPSKILTGKIHVYYACFNITAGILGMDAQVAKSTQCMEVKIYAKTSKDLVILIHKLKVSGSLAKVPSATDPVDLKSNQDWKSVSKFQ